MKRLIFRAAAAADVEAAHRWHEEQRPGLGEPFLQEVQACVERILENLRRYVACNRDVGRAPLRRFPHALFYRETTKANHRGCLLSREATPFAIVAATLMANTPMQLLPSHSALGDS